MNAKSIYAWLTKIERENEALTTQLEEALIMIGTLETRLEVALGALQAHRAVPDRTPPRLPRRRVKPVQGSNPWTVISILVTRPGGMEAREIRQIAGLKHSNFGSTMRDVRNRYSHLVVREYHGFYRATAKAMTLWGKEVGEVEAKVPEPDPEPSPPKTLKPPGRGEDIEPNRSSHSPHRSRVDLAPHVDAGDVEVFAVANELWGWGLEVDGVRVEGAWETFRGVVGACVREIRRMG